MKSKNLTIAFVSIGIFCTPLLTFAGTNPPPAAAPFDAGLSLLIAAGVGYASKKAHDKRKKNKLRGE